jgi:hypothetical protein
VKKLALTVLLAATMLPHSCHKPSRLPGPVTLPFGPSSAAIGAEHSFSSCTHDSYGDDVEIRFDWGDGDTLDGVPGCTPVTQ